MEDSAHISSDGAIVVENDSAGQGHWQVAALHRYVKKW